MKAFRIIILGLVVSVAFCISAQAQNQTQVRILSGVQMRELIINHKGQDLLKDTDGDGISDALELQFGTDPMAADTDGDLVPDGIEMAHGLDPTKDNPYPEFVYLVTKLPIPTNYSDAEAYDISNTGIVSGAAYWHATTLKDSAVRWNMATGSMETAPNDTDSYGWAVNDNGAIVGKYNGVALYWQSGVSPRTVGLSDSHTNYSSGINFSGKIVGYLNSQFPGNTGAYAWADNGTGTGDFTHLSAPSGYRFARAEAINDEGKIVGSAISIITGKSAGVIWNGTTPAVMTTSMDSTEPALDQSRDINRIGAVLGIRDSKPAVWTLTEGRRFLPMGTNSSMTAWKMNSFGEIVGILNSHPTLWRPDGAAGWEAISINPEILDDEVALSFWPNGINDAGQIVGSYYDGSDNKLHPVVLTPILRPRLAVDANRDGEIKLDDSDITTAERPYRFWVNDDDDSGDTGGSDNPLAASSGSVTRNCDDFIINGPRDLIDWFPVFLDIKKLVQQYMPSFAPGDGGVRYKLKQADGALKTVFTKLTRADALKYQTQDMGAVYGGDLPLGLTSSLDGADAFHVSPDGIEFFWKLRDLYDLIVNQDGCVLLLEGRAPTANPLVLALERPDGTLIAELKLQLTISPVEQMFRHLNLREGPDAPQGNDANGQPLLIGDTSGGHAAMPTGMSDRTAFPDEPDVTGWLFFIHGYNVSGQAARGWGAEMFKRFYWGGNKARFVGVTWFGNPKGAEAGNIVQGYHWAVRNAVVTAQQLAAKVNDLPGRKTMIGHSQGCWVASVAVVDFGMNVDRLCLLDAAFARECFDGEAATDVASMVPTFWQNYPSWSWSANWHQAFASGDARSALTWRARLAPALGRTAVHNFYSSTEDVLEKFPGTPTLAVLQNAFRAVANLDTAELGRYAWICQEKTKGDKALFTQGSGYGGWGFNLHDGLLPEHPKWYVPSLSQPVRRPKTPEEIGPAAPATIESLHQNPVFRTGWGYYDAQNPTREIIETSPIYNSGPEWIIDLYQSTTGSFTAGTYRTQLLAEAVPGLSLPVGANETTALEDNNNDMPQRFAHRATWPRGTKEGTQTLEWRHSDIREVAFVYMHELFAELSK